MLVSETAFPYLSNLVSMWLQEGRELLEKGVCPLRYESNLIRLTWFFQQNGSMISKTSGRVSEMFNLRVGGNMIGEK